MQSFPPLTILEEFLLLALDEATGAFCVLPQGVFDHVTAAAVLMDLMASRRVDCDLRHLFVTDPAAMDDDLLDPVLRALALDPVRSSRSIRHELRFLSEEGEILRDRAMQRLLERGILRYDQQKILWGFGGTRMTMMQNHPVGALKLRVIRAVQAEDIPTPRDVALIALLRACGLFPTLLNRHELAAAETRIAQVARMDILGQAAAKAAAEASMAMIPAVQ